MRKPAPLKLAAAAVAGLSLGALVAARQPPVVPPELAPAEAAATAGDAAAQARLGAAFDRGEGVARDAKAARRWYEMAAAQKHPEACRRLGEMYLKGEGGKRDKKKAMELWKTAEAAGDPIAPMLAADLMFAEVTGGKEPASGKFRISNDVTPAELDDISAWYAEAVQRDPRPEARERAQRAMAVLAQLKSGMETKGRRQ
jgi:TPR repeat protein